MKPIFPNKRTRSVQHLLALASPANATALITRMLAPLSALAFLMLGAGTLYVFAVVPDDYVQGAAVKIMYIHVPCAWLSMLAYLVMTGNSVGILVFRHPLAEAAQKAAAPLGAVFTALCLITGSLWGKPMWGTYWVWDARLTSELILLLIYLGLIALMQAGNDPAKAARVAAVMCLAGLVNLPIIKFSVDWWNTLHQPASILRLDGAHMSLDLLLPLLFMALAFTLVFVCLYGALLRNEIVRRKLRRLKIMAAQERTRASASNTTHRLYDSVEAMASAHIAPRGDGA